MRNCIVISLLVCLFVGCDEHRKPGVVPNVVVDDVSTATSIHKQSAAMRADAYEKLADAVDSSAVKTVNDAVNFTNPMFVDMSTHYTQKINELRKVRLHGADDVLPADAATTFRLFAKEYREAAK